MPPRKKQRLSRGASTPAQPENQQQQTATTTPSAQPEVPPKSVPENDPVTDPWTDEQETSLLKGVIKWKPVGMHKHFRMLAISEHMKSQGYAASNEEHTRIPGIWKKLGTLYNLQPLDERESYIPDPTDDSDPSKELYCPFELPEEEYGDMMFARRLAPDGSSSPPMSATRSSQRASTVPDTDEPRSSPAPARRGRGKRAARPTTRGTRSSKLSRQTESSKGRQSDKAGSVDTDEKADDGEEDGDEEGTTEAGKDDSDGDEEGGASTGGAPSPSPRGTRGQATRGKRKKGRGGGTRRTGRR